jgi:hypothetical protein
MEAIRDSEKEYSELYGENEWFRDQYRNPNNRRDLYNTIYHIVRDLKVRSVVDIGCSYGLMIDLMNANNIDAFGLDFAFESLKEFHKELTRSKDKFLYGSVNDEKVIEKIFDIHAEAITIIDTLRHIENPGNLRRVDSQFIVIREACNNRRVKSQRRNEFDVRLYSPGDLLKLFPEYRSYRIYFCNYRLTINRPPKAVLCAINAVFPSYTIVLRRRPTAGNPTN